MKISQFATDLDLEENGAWVDIGDGGMLLVARMDNPAYRDRIRKLTKPFKAQIRNNTLDDKLFDELIIKAMSETILLDWKGIEDDKGKEIKYTQAAAAELMTGLKDFRKLVAEIANNQETFRKQEAIEEGNS